MLSAIQPDAACATNSPRSPCARPAKLTEDGNCVPMAGDPRRREGHRQTRWWHARLASATPRTTYWRQAAGIQLTGGTCPRAVSMVPATLARISRRPGRHQPLRRLAACVAPDPPANRQGCYHRTAWGRNKPAPPRAATPRRPFSRDGWSGRGWNGVSTKPCQIFLQTKPFTPPKALRLMGGNLGLGVMKISTVAEHLANRSKHGSSTAR